MTAVPGREGTSILICDHCGAEDSGGGTRDADLVWPVVSELGWTGSAFATGPHRCPSCRIAPPVLADQPTLSNRPRAQGASYAVQTPDGVDAALITPLTDLDADLSECLREDLMRAAASHRHVILDLHAVGFIDSAALGLLVRAHQHAKEHGATFDLAAPSRFVLTVLHTMRLEGVFRTFPDPGSALRAIKAQTPDHDLIVR